MSHNPETIVTKTENPDGTWTLTRTFQTITGSEGNLVNGEWVTTNTFRTETETTELKECGVCPQTRSSCKCDLTDEERAAIDNHAEWLRRMND